MTKASFFYSREAEKNRAPGRRLPDIDASRGSLRVAAGEGFTSEVRDYLSHLPTEDILSDVCSPAERARLRQTAQYFPSLYLLLSEYAREYPRVTVEEAELPTNRSTVSIAAHCLFFAVGTVLRAADAALTDCAISATVEGDEIVLRITAPRAALSEEEAIAAFRLSERELEVMRAMADAAGFSLSAIPGDNATIALSIPTSVHNLGSMAAASDPGLYRAFFLPRMYFV